MEPRRELSRWRKALRSGRWLPSLAFQAAGRRFRPARGGHLIIGVADHFEPHHNPAGLPVDQMEAERRIEAWRREYPRAVTEWRDADGHPFKHTYFYPAEQSNRALLEAMAAHCREGWGELEVHLHHGVKAPDTAENTRRLLESLRDELASLGCLARREGDGHSSPPRYAFVHGNWALANSWGGRYCGVDNEMRILAETGCYADFTLPSAPSPPQVAKVNSLYEYAGDPDRPAPHRHGPNLSVGRPPSVFPIMVQGPLGLDFSRLPPRIENSEITAAHPPTLSRLRLWRQAGICVKGRPDWLFIKLHCHGMLPGDAEVMYGDGLRAFLRDLARVSAAEGFATHFVTAREMTNIILAACEGREGNPGDYRDYRFQLRGKAANWPPLAEAAANDRAERYLG